MLRGGNPTDLAGLLLLQARTRRNSARSRRVLAAGPRWRLPYLTVAVDALRRRGPRRAFVLSKRGLASGIAVVERRLGATVWEATAIHTPRGDLHTAPELLDNLAPAVADLGGQRLLLRLDAADPMTEAARRAQFTPYVVEELYLRVPGPQEPSPLPQGMLREAGEADAHQLYRLYQSVVPAPAREVEGLTFTQWRESLDLPRGWRCVHSLLLARQDAAEGWAMLAAAGGRGMLDVLVARAAVDTEGLIAAAIAPVARHELLLCLVPAYQQHVGRALCAQGFEKADEFVVFARHVASRVRQHEVVPAGVVTE